MEHAPQGTGIPVFDRKSTISVPCTMHSAGAGISFPVNLPKAADITSADFLWLYLRCGCFNLIVIPGRASWRELWCAIAHLRIHTPDRGYGFRACAKRRIYDAHLRIGE